MAILQGLPVAACALAGALLLDRLGEPPAVLHPVVWIGRALQWTRAPWSTGTPAAAFVRGTAVWLLGAAATVAAAMLLSVVVQRLQARGPWLRLLAVALLAL